MTSVFISGSRKINRLNDKIREKLDNIVSQNFQVFIGDANGADKSSQNYLLNLNYKNVKIFCSGKRCRNNLGDWNVENVLVDSNLTGRDFYTQKDKIMAANADYGLVLWDGKSPGSLNNIVELLKNNKKSLVYYSPEKKFYSISTLSDVEALLNKCDKSCLDTISKKIKLSSSIKEIQGMAQGSLSF